MLDYYTYDNYRDITYRVRTRGMEKGWSWGRRYFAARLIEKYYI